MEIIQGYLVIDGCRKRLANARQKHYWVYIEDEEYYFKPCNMLKAYKEKMGYYVAKLLSIDACFYDFAILDGNCGCISNSMRAPNCKLIPGELILMEYFSSSSSFLGQLGLSKKAA